MKIQIYPSCNLQDTPEGVATDRLKELLLSSIPEEICGQINIAPKNMFSNRCVINADFVIWGHFTNFVLPNYYSPDGNEENRKDLQIKDFFTILEEKGHPADRVSLSESHVLVEYTLKTQDVTEHVANLQKSLMDDMRFEDIDVWISKAIWFNSVNKDELRVLGIDYHNCVLSSRFEFKDLIDIIIAQGLKPNYDKDNERYVLSAIDSPTFDKEFINFLYKSPFGVCDDMEIEDEPDTNQHPISLTVEKAEAIAKDYFYYKKKPQAYYYVSGRDGFNSDECDGYVEITDEEASRIKKIVIDSVNSREDATEPVSTYEEAVAIVSFSHLYRTISELFNMLWERLSDIDVYYPKIDFSTRYYDFDFSFLVYNYDDNSIALPKRISIRLTDDAYLYLLKNVLSNNHFNYNDLVSSNPELAADLNMAVNYDYEEYDPFIILFDEVRKDANAIVASSEFHEYDPQLVQNTDQNIDSSDLPF